MLIFEAALMQDPWLRLLGILALGALGLLLHCLRLRYLTARLAERLHVRTAERERIARTLHDTFLQTVHGLVMHIDAVASTLPADDGVRKKLETVLQDARSAIGEGLDQLQELRATGTCAVEEIIADAVRRLRCTDGVPAVELTVDGERQALYAPVTEEVGEIAREALRNATAHAGATRIAIRLVYGRQHLSVSISDNGRGIDAAILAAGQRSGHWGMTGMRERAQRIGARLHLDSKAGRGTLVRLMVPAARAYIDVQPWWLPGRVAR